MRSFSRKPYFLYLSKSLNEQFERHTLPALEIATLLLGIIVIWGRRLLDHDGNVG